jgi:uracil-DNA glycosylase
MGLMPQVEGIIALGQIAFQQISAILRGRIDPSARFAHAALSRIRGDPSNGSNVDLLPNLAWVLTSYHPSRQNTLTGRLTQIMFDQVWQIAKEKLSIS